MLSEEQIRQALHASRVVPLSEQRPDGPLGLEQLAAAVSRVNPAVGASEPRICRSVTLDHKTWEKLDQLAETTTQTTSQYVTASQVASAIIEQFVATLPQRNEIQE